MAVYSLPPEDQPVQFEGVKVGSKFKIESSYIIGLPPSYYYSNENIPIMMPVLELTPALPIYQSPTESSAGIKLFTLDELKGIEQYEKILRRVGIRGLFSYPIKIAFSHESPFSETFSNEYSESMFEQAANFGVPFAEELQAITGTSSLGEAISQISKDYNDHRTNSNSGLFSMLNNMSEYVGGAALSTLANATSGIEDRVKKMFPNRGGQLLNLLSGHNLDFPMIWRGSNYTPNYSISVKLYNPDPTSDQFYLERIVEPLARILAFAVPVSTSNSTFNFPVMCRVVCPGLFSIKAGAITNIEVIKGGDSNDVSMMQRPGTIDLRITFMSLYNSLVGVDDDSDDPVDKNRPTLENYIDTLKKKTLVGGFTNPTDNGGTQAILNDTDRDYFPTPSNVQTIDLDSAAAARVSPDDRLTAQSLTVT